MYCVRLDGLHGAEHAVFHAKLAVVLQKHDAVAGGKIPLAVIGLECQLAAKIAPIPAGAAPLALAQPMAVAGYATPRQLAAFLQGGPDLGIDGANIGATVRHGNAASLRTVFAMGEVIAHDIAARTFSGFVEPDRAMFGIGRKPLPGSMGGERNRRLALPVHTLPADFRQFGMADALGNRPERRAGADRLQLLVIADQHDFRAGPLRLADEAGELPATDHDRAGRCARQQGRCRMNQATFAWAAFRNMMRAAARDPIWAIVALIAAPFRAGMYLARAAFLLVLVLFVVGFGLRYLIEAAGFPPGTLPSTAGDLVTLAIVLILAFRMMTNPMIQNFGDMDGDTHGTARFATAKEIAPLARSESGLLVGRDPKTKKLLRYDGPAHLMTMAPTRTGKGVGTIIPNLLTANRSVICIDPKGENAKIAGRAREQFGPVFCLDPFDVTGKSSAAYNPLDALDPDGLDVAEDAMTLADALVHDAPGEAGEAHWNEEAKALIAGIILHIAAHETRDRRTLSTLRECLTLAPETFAALLKEMQRATAAGGLVARAANRHLGKSDREAAGVLSAAQRHTHFLDSPRMSAVLGRSDFRFGDLKSRTGTVFLVLPPDRLSTYSRWLRLLVTQSLTDMARTANTSPAPVLYLLDEFAALGHLAPVERAMGLMAGYGVQLWPILQDVHQLRATYGQRAGTFLSNAGVLQIFGVNDHESARLVSDLLGQETVVFQPMSRALDSEKSGLTYGEQHVGRPLLTPDEVRHLPHNTELLFIAGQRPIVAEKLQYYSDAEFRGMFDQA